MKFYYDLHIHSALSPCASLDMSPSNIVRMAALAGLSVIAITDHNSVGNVESAMRIGSKEGICVIPALELTTVEEVHVLCYFETLEGAREFGRLVSEKQPRVKNRPSIFGEQFYFNEKDDIIGEEPYYLGVATEIGLFDVVRLVRAFGGIAVPAHVDRPSFSLLSNLGQISHDMHFCAAEISYQTDLEGFLFRKPEFIKYHIIQNSDAHDLCGIYDASNWLNLDKLTISNVIAKLL